MTAGQLVPRPIRPAVLLYHRIAPVTSPADPLCVTPEQFDAQMRYLAEMGFTTDAPKCPAALPAKPVVITFDDGYLDTYSTAFPILQRYGLTATVFIVSGCIGATSDAWGPPTPAPLLTWSQIDEMSRAGISFQSHTRTHPDLTRCRDAVALSELAGSRAEIEDHVGRAVNALAYPFGRFDARVLGLAERAGYRIAWAAGRAAQGPFSTERFQISSKDSMASFAVKASGWGGWLRRARAVARFGADDRGGSGSNDRWAGVKPC
jgi:peptidoglycan/xylan/chitin deacetylase (PgdA/CDA1 family)